MAPTRAITHGAFSPRAMSSPSLRLRRGPQDPGAATPSRSPPRGPFVLPQDRPPRRPRGSAASDASADADPGEQWCGWMCRLCTYKEAPEWSVHNKYIHTGYRTGFGWRAAVRSVRVPPDPAPARSLSSLRRASTSPSPCLAFPERLRHRALRARRSRVTLARARVRPPRSPADARPRALAPSAPRAQVLMVHNETCNIWTHLVGLAIFVAITVTMATGWGAHHMPALPDTWVTGTNATRAALVARTVRFRLGVEGSRAALSDLAARCETDPISSSGPTRIRTRDPSTASETKTTAAIVARRTSVRRPSSATRATRRDGTATGARRRGLLPPLLLPPR